MASVSATKRRMVAVNRGVRENEGTRRDNRRESKNNHGPAEVRVPPTHARIHTDVAPATPHRHRHHHHRHDHHTTSTTTTNTATATDVEALHLSHSFRHFFTRPSPTSVTYIFRGAASVLRAPSFFLNDGLPGLGKRVVVTVAVAATSAAAPVAANPLLTARTCRSSTHDRDRGIARARLPHDGRDSAIFGTPRRSTLTFRAGTTISWAHQAPRPRFLHNDSCATL
ncbi:PREDICTED: LOW QUALITY PROTEIN: uncharacterized protein LOC108570957 [Habropoda laboriosa]|uniref:LOW QUALITY PROTEIN: uncharacterized protein LOC108570957 n=1 Tax=Habropoda laboriosa TaxID=597456 RepID=UPI00083CD625|nr:PREDICTED: LOW QUALITY PROTEIN: uncharacterized protein LOC108570957 [Habropoda laboriosa]